METCISYTAAMLLYESETDWWSYAPRTLGRCVSLISSYPCKTCISYTAAMLLYESETDWWSAPSTCEMYRAYSK